MTVSINIRNGLLSLRFRDPSGRQRRISLGIRDTRGNRGLAAMRADLIAADLSSGTYDPTHKRYLPAKQQEFENRTVEELFTGFSTVSAGSRPRRDNCVVP